MKFAPIACLILPLVPAIAGAEETRSLGAHEHGSGTLNIAFEGNSIAMEVEAPGADIVGFEHEATSDEDRKLIETAVANLGKPLDLFVLSAEAGCSVVSASVELHGDEEHDDHDDEHAHDDDHANEAKDDHAHDDDHEHDTKDDHDDEHHDDHADHEDEGAEHAEFHAEYALTCSDMSALSKIEFTYFERFPNALELDVQIVSAKGAQAHEVERDDPVLDLQSLF
ncbi:hypothetical protein TRL7639_00995 [Falsiruegeria litorea R37]|uniref:DUF2796 domain-containing protein n=1 Tax=Falsiruegeria litorea R37 TaxID=1200284 RepID=A0A1Y5RWF7_9RHOB|nr:DUF2796 domain-containing protein [Falsiruegeria litorea]SLN27004.1 hypothetical protein TRL7639_00995 [Falsiruegeria litorea R37]